MPPAAPRAGSWAAWPTSVPRTSKGYGYRRSGSFCSPMRRRRRLRRGLRPLVPDRDGPPPPAGQSPWQAAGRRMKPLTSRATLVVVPSRAWSEAVLALMGHPLEERQELTVLLGGEHGAQLRRVRFGE